MAKVIATSVFGRMKEIIEAALSSPRRRKGGMKERSEIGYLLHLILETWGTTGASAGFTPQSFTSTTKTIVADSAPNWIKGMKFIVKGSHTSANDKEYTVASCSGTSIVTEEAMTTDATAGGTAKASGYVPNEKTQGTQLYDNRQPVISLDDGMIEYFQYVFFPEMLHRKMSSEVRSYMYNYIKNFTPGCSCFDIGSGASISKVAASNFVGTGAFSIEFYINSCDYDRAPIMIKADNDNYIAISWPKRPYNSATDDVALVGKLSGVEFAVPLTVVPNEGWTYLYMYFNGTSLTLYKDGGDDPIEVVIPDITYVADPASGFAGTPTITIGQLAGEIGGITIYKDLGGGETELQFSALSPTKDGGMNMVGPAPGAAPVITGDVYSANGYHPIEDLV